MPLAWALATSWTHWCSSSQQLLAVSKWMWCFCTTDSALGTWMWPFRSGWTSKWRRSCFCATDFCARQTTWTWHSRWDWRAFASSSRRLCSCWACGPAKCTWRAPRRICLGPVTRALPERDSPWPLARPSASGRSLQSGARCAVATLPSSCSATSPSSRSPDWRASLDSLPGTYGASSRSRWTCRKALCKGKGID